MVKKRVAVITGTRAEYGLLKPVIRKFQEDASIEVMLLVTGMHLSPEFGMTINEIEEDNIPITEKIEILLSSDSAVGVTKSMALALIGFGEAFERNSPDIVILLGDRFEIFCAAAAATVARVPIAHIHGGELTLGAIDDAFRHAITKMSYLHFPATEEYRNRIIQMGESPDRVYNVGALGVEAALSLNFLSREQLEGDLQIHFGQQNFLVTFHPATLDHTPAIKQLEQILGALNYFPDASIFFTAANADMQGRQINQRLIEYAQNRTGCAAVFESLGHRRYLSLMKFCNVVIGNSSSGIIEAPSLGIPTVNVGNRQKGRTRAPSVIDCDINMAEITRAIEKAINMSCTGTERRIQNPYDGGPASERIVSVIVSALANPMLDKEFYTLRTK